MFPNCQHGLRRPAGVSRHGGFTLIELMVSVTIISVLTAIAIPHFRAHILQSRLETALPYLASIQARQRMFYHAKGKYCCSGGATSEATIDSKLGLRIEEIGDFCFISVCTDSNLCQATSSGGFIAAAETGDATPEFEVWAILREAGSGPIGGPNGTTCTPHPSKRPPTGWVEASGSGAPGRQGTAIVLRYPPPQDGPDTVTTGRGVSLVWTNGVSSTDAMRP